MKANNLSISMPYLGCDRDCPFCISKLTGYMNTESNWNRMCRNVPKVSQFAKSAQITSVSITGKGESTLDFNKLHMIICAFAEFPVELQTNGIRLKNNLDRVKGLYRDGLDVIAISVYTEKQMWSMNSLIEYASNIGLIPRITFVVTKYLSITDIEDYVSWCNKAGVRQISFRNTTIPIHGCVNTPKAKKAIAWIKNNNNEKLYKTIQDQLYSRPYPLIRKLPYRASIFDVNGVAVTCFDYCIQDKHKDDDIRSLIFQEDGHLYTTWGSKASILF